MAQLCLAGARGGWQKGQPGTAMEAGPHGAHSARPSRARVAPETKGSTREGSRSSFSSPTRRPRTPSDAAALRSRLDMARASGRTFSLAVQWPMRAFGVVSLFASAIALAVTLSPLTGLSGLDRLAALLGCSLLAPVGVLAVLHSLLPSNVQLARGVMIALIPVNLGFGLFGFISFLLPYTAASLACARAGARAHATLTVLAHHHSLAVPCWLMAVEAACEGLKVACNFSAALFLARAARVHAAPLAALWRSVGWVMVGFGALNVVPPIAALCGGVPTAADAVRAALFGVLLALGVRTLQPAHRRAVMAWLARRGERLSAAAGVAELIGGRGVAQIEALAVPRFRCVSAEFVALAHLRDNKPDRSLFALTQPAAIGDVDVRAAPPRSSRRQRGKALSGCERARAFSLSRARSPLTAPRRPPATIAHVPRSATRAPARRAGVCQVRARTAAHSTRAAPFGRALGLGLGLWPRARAARLPAWLVRAPGLTHASSHRAHPSRARCVRVRARAAQPLLARRPRPKVRSLDALGGRVSPSARSVGVALDRCAAHAAHHHSGVPARTPHGTAPHHHHAAHHRTAPPARSATRRDDAAGAARAPPARRGAARRGHAARWGQRTTHRAAHPHAWRPTASRAPRGRGGDDADRRRASVR